MRALFLALLLTAAAPAEVEVRLSNFEFAPEEIRLTAGAPVTLILVNSGSGGHNFSAREFFAAAREVTGPVENGTVEVPGHRRVEVRLTPARGSYRLRCTHTLHTAFGMSGRIVVE